jgi:hypothetical protein
MSTAKFNAYNLFSTVSAVWSVFSLSFIYLSIIYLSVNHLPYLLLLVEIKAFVVIRNVVVLPLSWCLCFTHNIWKPGLFGGKELSCFLMFVILGWLKKNFKHPFVFWELFPIINLSETIISRK